MKTEEHAIEHVSQGESNIGSRRDVISSIDWKEFWHLLISWSACGLVIFIVLIILTMTEESTELFKDLVMRVDTISLVFSLVLSAGLEQIWTIKEDLKYKFSQIAEVILAVGGLILYLAYSFWSIYRPENYYYLHRFWINMTYILLSFMCVVLGFIMRAKIDE